MSALDKYLADQPAEPTPAAPAPSTDSAFTKGLRSGMTSLGGQSHALLGQAGELVGANDFAASQRAASLAAQQQAAQEREGMVESYKDVNGLRGAFDYTTGLVGSALPAMAAGIAGAKLMPGKGTLPALTGATLATAPSTIGAQFEQQQANMQANPGQPQPGVIDRTLTGVGAGLAQAGIMNAVPQLVGGKFFGAAAQGAERAAMPIGKALMENVPEAVLGNAVAGVASPLVGQVAASHLNPERDRSADNGELAEGAVGGAVMGVPFAALGTAGSMKGAKAAKPVEPLARSTAAEKGVGQPLPGAEGAETAAPKTFAEKVADLITPLKKEPVTAEDHTAPIVQGDTPETMAAKDTAGASAATEKARRTMDKLLADQEATGLHQELGTLDPATSAGQARIGELNVQHFDAKQRAKIVADANAAMDKTMVADEGFPDVQFSKDTSGVDAKIHAVLDKTRDWEYQSDDQRAAAASLLRKVIVGAEDTGRVPAPAREAISLLLGKDPVGALTEMYDAIGTKEPAKADKFYTALTTLGEAQKVDNTLLDVVRSALPEDMAGSVRMPQLKQFVAQMKDLTSEEAFKDMTPAEQAVKKQQINAKLAETFGDKADAVNEAFAKHAKAEAKLTVPDRTEALGAETDLGDTPAEAPPTYYGKKGDNPFLLNNEAHAREFPDTPDAQRPQSARLDTAMKNAEHGQVEWQSAREHAREVGMSKEELMRLTGDKPDDFGLVRAMPKGDDNFGLKPADIEAMKLGDHSRVFDKTSGEMVNKRLAPKESWIAGDSTITLPGKKTATGNGVDEHFDATRIASWMSRQDGKNADRSVVGEAKGELYRTAQAFSEGIAALSDHYGRKIDVKDETVVVKGKNGQPDTTWGDLQQVLRDAALDDKGRTEVKALREQLRAPTEAYRAAREEARAKVERDSPNAGEDELVSLMGASDRAVKKQFASERAAIEDLNSKIEEVHNAALDRQFAGSDKSTGELKQLVSDFTLRLDNAEQAVARLTALEAKRGLSEWQQGQLERQQRIVKKMTEIIPNVEAAIERRADRAKFAEGKELGNDYGTGRDSGAGIILAREQQRVAESVKSMYNDLLGRLDAHKPGSPGEGVVWKKEAERVAAQIKTSFGKTPDTTSKEYRRLERFQRLIEAKDRARIEALRDRADVVGTDLAERAQAQELGRRDETSLGVSEIDPAGEIHLAEAQYGKELGAVSARSRQVAGEYTPPARAKDVVRGPVEVMAELGKRADELQASKVANVKRTGDMLHNLLDNQEVMSPSDRLTMKTLLDAKTTLQLGQSVKALFDKYSGAKGWSKEGKNSIAETASEGGFQHEANMRQVARSTDPVNLQQSVMKLLTDKRPNQAKQELIAAMNDRIGKLIEDNPEAAYGMLVRGNEAPTTKSRLRPDVETMDALQERLTDRTLRHLDSVENAAVEKALGRVSAEFPDEAAGIKVVMHDGYDAASTSYGDSGVISLNRDVFNGPVKGVDATAADRLVRVLAHELAHVSDRSTVDGKIVYGSESAPQLRPGGKAYLEAEASMKANPKLEKWFGYITNGSLADNRVPRELYAQLRALYVTDPAMMKEFLPRSFKLLDKGDENSPVKESDLAGLPWEMKSRAKTDPGVTMTSKERAKVVDHINKVTGNSVDVNAAAKMLYAGAYKEGFTDAAGIDHRPAINVSVHALDPTSVGYHESLHWFADHLRQNGDPKIFGALVQTADSPYVRNVLRTVFKDQPEVLKQVLNSAEERVAYMYQLYASGNLKLGDRTKTILDKISDYIRSVMGVWTNDQRAEHIMRYFNSGEYGTAMSTKGVNAHERSPMYRYLMEQGRNHTLDYLAKTAKPLSDLKDSVAATGAQRIRDMNIPALTKMADMVRLHGTQEGSDTGYLPAAGVEFRSWSNKLVDEMTVDKLTGVKTPFTFDEANEAFAATALGKQPKDAKQLKLMNAIDTIMTDMHAYMREAGVDIGDRRNAQGKYIPRQWDPAFVAGHQGEFRTMIQKYIDSGDFKGTADELMSRLMRDEGSEVESADFLARPGDQYAKKRELHFITAEDAAPFLEQNAMRVLTSYIKQGTRRAEWARRFEAMTADERKTYEAMSYKDRRDFDATRQTPIDKLRAAAVKQGATPEQMALVEKYMEGVTGQLGADVKPETRKLFGQLMVYQNLRLLPMGFFSSLIDPVGVAVRGGDMHDVFNNFKRGIMEIPRGFKKNPKFDEGYQLAEDMGVIDNAVLQHVMGASYGLNAVGNRARAINETLFKWNLMEQMNTSQRVAATEASLRFFAKHKDGDATPHSMRYLNELGLKPGDIKMIGTGKDARVAVRESDFKQLGMNDKAATAEFLKMRQAINSWVDGAVLRPDQSQKAIWMNDAHFSLIAHMKQFAFAFQDTILKRALAEAKHGNYQPAYSLAAYIPVMLAADLVKGAIQGGGSQPDWKQDWTLGDYLGSATQRAGLLGVGQFGADAIKDLHHGGVALGALGGPSLGQLSDIVSTAGGNRGFEHTVIDSMPANALWSGYLPKGVTHPEATGGKGGAGPTELNTVD